MPSLQQTRFFAAAAAALALAGCASDAKDDGPLALTIPFKSVVGATAFSCGSTYPGIGVATDAANQVLTPKDNRLYVHDVRLVNAAGADVPVTLSDVERWQHGGVALLDFEDGTGGCVNNGNAALRLQIEGTAPAGTYRGLKFKVGVPAALNHLQADSQPGPLNLSAMFWSWTSGYRFIRVEGTLPGAIVHLGSTACTARSATDPSQGADCTNENVMEVSLPTFDPAASKVVFDVGALFSGTDLSVTAAPSGGCMSAPTDPDCPPVFARLGLPFGADAGGHQTVFSVE